MGKITVSISKSRNGYYRTTIREATGYHGGSRVVHASGALASLHAARYEVTVFAVRQLDAALAGIALGGV